MLPYSKRRIRLEALANVLLCESSSPQELRDAATSLHDLLDSIGPDLPDEAARPLASGAALSPRDAAACTKDPLRTAMFLRGLNEAIEESRRRFRDRPIEIVYAGTGPYATLAVPLMPRLVQSDVRFTLIDVHRSSLASVERVLRYFGFTRFARKLIVCDATTYRHPPHLPLHIAITETMQRSLSVEPQVAIYRHLATQLHPNGVMVPQRVTVDLELSEAPLLALSDRRYRTRVGEIFQLSVQGSNARTLQLRTVSGNPTGMYVTQIQAYGRHGLAPGDSGLTEAEIVWELTNLTAGERIEFRYEQGTNPAIRFERTGKVSPRRRLFPA